MRISHEAIYQALYIEGRGALKRELVACLRTGRALRKPRERARNKPQGHVTADVVLSERPAEAEDRAVPGHWEGDLIIELDRSAIGTVVERTSRYTLLVHLPRLPGHGIVPPVKNGPALGGYGAVAMKDALTTMTTMPAELLRSLTWDRGKELSVHAQFKIETGIAVYFADRSLRDSARTSSVHQLIAERIALRRRSERAKSGQELLMPVTLQVTESVDAALDRWFDVVPAEFGRWVKAELTLSDDRGEVEDEGARRHRRAPVAIAVDG